MLVKNWMSDKVITVDVNDSMQDAVKLLKGHNIRMLPVMKKGELVGIVTDRDMKRASASDATTLEIHELLYLISTIKVKNIMTKDPITVPPEVHRLQVPAIPGASRARLPSVRHGQQMAPSGRWHLSGPCPP